MGFIFREPNALVRSLWFRHIWPLLDSSHPLVAPEDNSSSVLGLLPNPFVSEVQNSVFVDFLGGF